MKQRRHRPQLGPIEETTVERLDAGGEGVVTLAGGSAWVAGVLPGEVVRVRPAGKRRARLEALVRPAPERVTPACELAVDCGGCDWMHIAADTRRQAYRDRLTRLLAAADLQVDALPIQQPSGALAYRTRARLHLSAHGRGRARVGYRPPRSHRLLVVERCPVLSPALEPALAELAEVLGASRGEGDAQVALGPRQAGGGAARVVELHWHGELSGDSLAALSRMVDDGVWAGARVWLDAAREPACFGDPRPVVPGPDGRDLFIAAGGFAQASDEGGIALGRRVAELAAAREVGQLLELFAGSGTLSVALAPLAQRFHAVEQASDACAQLRENLAERGLEGRVTCADANERAVAAATTTVVLDPPRTGARGACEAIARARPHQVIYVSCNPVSLVRDLTVLCAARLRLATLELFELFPNTSHVEAIARLERTS